MDGSPAAQAGLERGDMILALNGEILSAENGLLDLLAAYEPGDEVKLSVYSSASQEKTEIPVVLGENPEDAEQAYLGINFQDFTGLGEMQFQQGIPFGNFPGLDEGNLPDEDLPGLQNDLFDEDFNLPESDVVNSLLVKEVVENGPADEAGLQEGDIILELDGKEVAGQEKFAADIRSYSPGDSITLTISRYGLEKPFDIKVILGENPTEAGAGYLGIRVGVFINMDVSMNNGPIFIDFLPFNAQARIGL
jgi:PDZ domain-containing secreted protein